MIIRFSTNLKCFNSNTKRKPELEATGRIILPNSILNIISGLEYEQDIMLFRIRNEEEETEVYAGVINFTMPEGEICTPTWMMDFLRCNDNDNVTVSFVTLPVATKIVLQPYSRIYNAIKYLDLQSILEYNLRRYPCLTQGAVISIEFNSRVYLFKILKTEPTNGVKIYQSNVDCDIVPSIYNFLHHWNEPDSDSSDDDSILPIEKVGYTIRGNKVKSIETPKPIHSTLFQRENDRIHNPKLVQKNIDDYNNEILPPKPPQPQKTNPYFSGKSQTIKRHRDTGIHYYYLELEKSTKKNIPVIASKPINKKLIEKAKNSTNPNPYKKPNIVQQNICPNFFQGNGRYINERQELNQPISLHINPICCILGKVIEFSFDTI